MNLILEEATDDASLTGFVMESEALDRKRPKWLELVHLREEDHYLRLLYPSKPKDTDP